MATQKIVLTSTPVQISNGTKEVFAQSMNFKNFRFVQKSTIPTDLTMYHVGTEISIGVGFSIWAWAEDRVVLVVSTQE